MLENRSRIPCASPLPCLHDNAGMTLVIPSVGCVSAKSSDRAPVCTGSSYSCQSVVLPQRQSSTTAHRRETPWGSLFAPCAQIPPCQCLIWRSDWLPRRILASNSPLPVPDLALLALPTGFRRASWPPTPPCQCLIWRSWPFRLAFDALLGRQLPHASA